MSGQDYEQLTLYPEDSPASRFPSPGSDEARQMTVTCGLKCLELCKISGPLGSLVRMLLGSSVWRSTRCYLTWKVSATPAKRLLYRLVPSMPRIGGTDVRLWHTVTAFDATCGDLESKEFTGTKHAMRLIQAARLWTTPTASDSQGTTGGGNSRSLRTDVGGQLNPMWIEWLMGFPIGWTELDV